jgi:uncharacterized protein (TIGR03067 family)
MTRQFILIPIVAALLLLPACSQKGRDEQSRKDREALQGEWEIVKAESDGAPPPPGLLDGERFVFSRDKMTLMGTTGTYELDATKTPRQIDFNPGSKRQSGIYELDGDNLKLCVGQGDDRPSEFKAERGTDYALFILKRKK